METSMALAIVFWIACGVLSYGITVGYFVNKFMVLREDGGTYRLAVGLALLGPISLPIIFFLSEKIKYGIRFRPQTDDEWHRANEELKRRIRQEVASSFTSSY